MTSLPLRNMCALARAWLRCAVQKALLTLPLPAATNALPSSTDGPSRSEGRKESGGEGEGRRERGDKAQLQIKTPANSSARSKHSYYPELLPI